MGRVAPFYILQTSAPSALIDDSWRPIPASQFAGGPRLADTGRLHRALVRERGGAVTAQVITEVALTSQTLGHTLQTPGVNEAACALGPVIL